MAIFNKRVFSLFFVMIMITSIFVGCGKTTTIANPMVPVTDDSEYESKLGIKWDTSKLPGEVDKTIISDKIAQVVFTFVNESNKKVEVTLRASKDEGEMINLVEELAGVYLNNYDAISGNEYLVKDDVILTSTVYGQKENTTVTYFRLGEDMAYSYSYKGNLAVQDIYNLVDLVFGVIGLERVEHPTETGKTIRPLPETLQATEQLSCTYPCYITAVNDAGDGSYVADIEIYAMELFDSVDIAGMQPGDMIAVAGEEIFVYLIQEGDAVNVTNSEGTLEAQSVYRINGGLDKGGIDLIAHEGGTFRVFGYDDHATYAKIYEATCPIAADASIVDHLHDFDGGDHTDAGISMKSSEFKEYFDNELEKMGGISYFNELDTIVSIENGIIVDITRNFIP